MSRRDTRRRGDTRPGWERPPAPPSQPSEGAPGPSLREQWERATVPARALLPLRFFAGATFLYAGIDKLLDPSFFDAASPASIQGQLVEFARVSPVGFLVAPMEPFAVILGLLIAFAEIAIGIGAITGLAFRLAAAGGVALSLLFWLTASWTTTPYYYGPDLPYALGWATLALAGDGGLFVPAWVRQIGSQAFGPWGAVPYGSVQGHHLVPEPDVSPQRRLVLQAGALSLGALAVYVAMGPLRVLGVTTGSGAGDTADGGDGTDGTDPGVTGDASTDPGAGTTDPAATDGSTGPDNTPATAVDDSAPPATAPLTGLAIAHVADVEKSGAKRFHVPNAAPAKYRPGDPGVIVKLADGTYAAFDARCTHEGCRVGYDKQDKVLLCPCHGAAFDPGDHGAVLGGPTRRPLLELPLEIDAATGTISIKA